MAKSTNLWDADAQDGATAKWRESRRVLPRPKMKARTIREREAREKDTALWLKYYFPRIFRLEFGAVHHEIIEAVEYTLTSGGRCAVAAPRGTGKSYLLDGCALLALVRRVCRFPVVIPWDSKGLKKALAFWVKALCFNDRFTRDYADMCEPFKACRGSSQRCMTFADEDGCAWGARLVVSEGLIVLPDSRGVIGGSTINGNPLGLHHTTDKGEGLRPDCILIDDPQDAETALSSAQINATIDLIDKDISGMSGPDTPMPMMMACTVKQKGDVAEHYLDAKSGWRAVRVAQITRWPDDMPLWEKWNEAQCEGEEEKDGGKAGLAFYAEHRESLVKGMAVSWDARYRKGEPDALYSAMFDYFRMGKPAFMAERQNDPQPVFEESPYLIDADVICSRTDGAMAAHKVPDWAQTVVAATDVNPSYGLTTAVVAFGANQRAHVLWYGVYSGAPLPTRKDDAPAVISRAVQTALAAHGAQLAAMNPRPAMWVIDGGGTPQDTVIGFCAVSVKACGLQGVTAFGRSAKEYRSTGKDITKVREQCCLKSPSMSNRWVLWNADYWREIAQLAWTSAPGLPGSCSLCAGNHQEFADQVCSEKLAWKKETPTGIRWEWHTKPGRHDYGDCMTMAFMAAAFGGIGTGGQKIQKRYIEQRKAKVQLE